MLITSPGLSKNSCHLTFGYHFSRKDESAMKITFKGWISFPTDIIFAFFPLLHLQRQRQAPLIKYYKAEWEPLLKYCAHKCYRKTIRKRRKLKMKKAKTCMFDIHEESKQVFAAKSPFQQAQSNGWVLGWLFFFFPIVWTKRNTYFGFIKSWLCC